MLRRIDPIGTMILAVVSVVGLARPVAAEWIQDGGALNVNALYSADYPQLATGNGTIYVVFNEYGAIYVKHLTHGIWVQDGGAVTSDGFSPSLGLVNGVPYVAWNNHSIIVNHLENSYWVQDGPALNINALSFSKPSLAADNNGMVYVSWCEGGGMNPSQLYVKHYLGGGQWVQDGGSLITNFLPTAGATTCSMAFDNNTPYVAWQEGGGINSIYKIFVKHLAGGIWVQDGGELNYISPTGAGSPSLAIDQGTPWVAFTENDGVWQVYVEHLFNGQWVLDGTGCLNVDPRKPVTNLSLAISHGIPSVAWSEATSTTNQIFVKQFTGGGWVQAEGMVNVDPALNAYVPSMIDFNGTLYVGWTEGTLSTARQTYVKHFNGTPGSPPVTGSGWKDLLLQVSPQVLQVSRLVTTRISVSIPKPGKYNLSCIALSGEKVSTIFTGMWDIGVHEISWNGSGCASGLHFILCEGEGEKVYKKIVIVR